MMVVAGWLLIGTGIAVGVLKAAMDSGLIRFVVK